MGFAGLMRLDAGAKNSSEKERMRDVRGAETRSVRFRSFVPVSEFVSFQRQAKLVCAGLGSEERKKRGTFLGWRGGREG